MNSENSKMSNISRWWTEAPSTGSGPITVLMVEDSFFDYEAVARTLRSFGSMFDLRWCETADEGRDYLLREGTYSGGYNAPVPQLVLLDLYLPGCLSGLDLLSFIRENPETEETPVVVFSTSDSPRDLERSRHAGANDFVRKPSDPQEFDSTIESILAAPYLHHLSERRAAR